MEFLSKMLEEQYEIEIAKKIIEGYTKQRKTTFRVNTLKSSIIEIEEKLKQANIEYDRIPWYEEAIIVKNADKKTIQELDIYKNGEIYLQSLSSMLPPIILGPKERADILDMAAAPGGKTTQMAALSKNKAHITACEKNKIRAERLKYNIDKQGATSVFVMTKDARYIDDFFSFDQILLDAPCSGSGTLVINDNEIKNEFTKELVERSMSAQLNLLKKAIKILKPGSEMVYSTCSVLACENEDIIQNVLSTGKVEVVPIDFAGIENIPVLPTKIDGTLCVCPNELYEGFFVAKLRKK